MGVPEEGGDQDVGGFSNTDPEEERKRTSSEAIDPSKNTQLGSLINESKGKKVATEPGSKGKDNSKGKKTKGVGIQSLNRFFKSAKCPEEEPREKEVVNVQEDNIHQVTSPLESNSEQAQEVKGLVLHKESLIPDVDNPSKKDRNPLSQLVVPHPKTANNDHEQNNGILPSKLSERLEGIATIEQTPYSTYLAERNLKENVNYNICNDQISEGNYNEKRKKESNQTEVQNPILYTVQVKDIRRVLNQLMEEDKYGWFCRPVDPVEMEIPDYYDVIKKPMDLEKVSEKLANLTTTGVSSLHVTDFKFIENFKNPPAVPLNEDLIDKGAMGFRLNFPRLLVADSQNIITSTLVRTEERENYTVKKLNSYSNIETFVEDTQQVFYNAIVYNEEPDHFVHIKAQTMLTVFSDLLHKVKVKPQYPTSGNNHQVSKPLSQKKKSCQDEKKGTKNKFSSKGGLFSTPSVTLSEGDGKKPTGIHPLNNKNLTTKNSKLPANVDVERNKKDAQSRKEKIVTVIDLGESDVEGPTGKDEMDSLSSSVSINSSDEATLKKENFKSAMEVEQDTKKVESTPKQTHYSDEDLINLDKEKIFFLDSNMKKRRRELLVQRKNEENIKRKEEERKRKEEEREREALKP